MFDEVSPELIAATISIIIAIVALFPSVYQVVLARRTLKIARPTNADSLISADLEKLIASRRSASMRKASRCLVAYHDACGSCPPDIEFRIERDAYKIADKAADQVREYIRSKESVTPETVKYEMEFFTMKEVVENCKAARLGAPGRSSHCW